MKKILYVITKSNFGGAQRYVYELATHLPKDRFEVSVALGGDGLLKTKLIEKGIKVHSIDGAARDISITKDLQVLWRLYKIFKEVKPDVVHLNSSKISGLGAVAARFAGVKHIIYTNHGWPFREPRRAWQKLIIKFLSWLTVMFADTTIVLSERERADADKWPWAAAKLRVIPNGLVPFELLPRENALSELIGSELAAKISSDGVRVVGTIAELHRNKGLIHAIEGMGLLNDKKTIFIIIGEGEERNRLEELISSLDLGDSVFLVGSIDDARTHLLAFDFFLLPSVKEGLPYAIMEAGFAGLPVIATNVGGIPEIISNLSEGLLISPRRPQEIKHALIYVENHPADIKQFAENLQKKIKTVYSFDRLLSSIEDLYLKDL